MYLSDKQLLARIPDLDIECPSDDEPFSVAEQVQAASIDLRLSDVFWCPRKGQTIDLLKEKAIQVQPYRFWVRKQLHRSHFIELKPGEMVLGRVYEKLTIPNDCSGKFTGRSSYARLGLIVTCTGDFANPGYRGHMPLQLVNTGPLTLRVYPYLPVCQLILVKLSEPSSKKYGGTDVASKYMNDDGGPSYWWRDKYIRRLQAALQAMDASESIQRSVYARLEDVDNEVLDRLGDFLDKHRAIKKVTADDLLIQFSSKEMALRRRHENANTIWSAITTAAFGTAITALFTADAPLWIKISACVVTLLCLLKAIWVYFGPRPHNFLGPEEIRALPKDAVSHTEGE